MEINMTTNGILFFTDFHAHLFMEFAKHDDQYVTDRYREQHNVLETILTTARDEKLALVFAGDLFHKRGAVDIRVFNDVYSLFAKYTPDIPHTYLLRGNHDSYDNSMGSASSLDTFSVLPKVEVISTPLGIDANDIVINGKPAHLDFMPYGENIDEMKAQLQTSAERLTTKHYNINVSHLGIDGASQGQSNHRLASAFSLNDMHPDKYNLVYLGHYHKRQYLGHLDNVLYGGSTMQLSFSDEGQEKGYDILGANGVFTFHPLVTTKFVTLDHWTKTDQKAYADDYVRLRLPESTAKAIAPDVVDSNIRVEAQVEASTDTRLDIDANDSPEAVTAKYMDTYYPDLKQLALDTMKEVVK